MKNNILKMMALIVFVLQMDCFAAETWKVMRNVTIGPSGTTNAMTTIRQQMSGLTNGLRSCVVKQTLDGVRTMTTVFFDETTGIATETVKSDVVGETDAV